MNAHQGNGNRPEEGTALSKTEQGAIATKPKDSSLSNVSFKPDTERSVVLKQSPTWTIGVIWTIVGVTLAAIIWAYFARIEQVVSATGQLKPEGKVKEIKIPVNGVVEKVMVKDGESVKKGQTLMILDSTASQAEFDSLKKVRQAVLQENQFYTLLMSQSLSPTQVEAKLIEIDLPKSVATLARNRVSLLSENQLYQVQLGEAAVSVLPTEQLSRLSAAKTEQSSKAASAQLEIAQLQKQLSQTRVQLTDTRTRLVTDQLLLKEIQTRNEQVTVQAQQSLQIEEDILGDIEPLGEEGAIAQYQINKQRQSVSDRRESLIEQQANGQIELERQTKEVQARLGEIERFQEEEKRILVLIDQAQERLINTTSLSEKEVRDRIAENQKRIAEIDSQLTKVLVDNEKRVSELDSQISNAQQTIKYQKVTAPIDGVVFDLQAYPGFVPQPSQAETVLKIVPAGCPSGTTDEGCLIAEVDVTNEDIGFVRPGQKTDVRIASYSYSEYGDIKGEVISIGSDALPPDEIHREYRFPVKIRMNRQDLQLKEGDILSLQSGMAVTANIKVNENRTVLSLFTELFTKKVDSLKEVR